MRIYDTLRGEKVEFKPVHEGRVGIYVCGPTTYDYAHIGHARTAMVFDMLRRFLEYVGYDVVLVSNITDIDDKIIAKARERNEDPIKMAHRYAEEYLKDMESLRIRRPNIIPKATRHIDEIINLVKTLVEKGYAYESGGDVYFSVGKFKDYGKLSHRSVDEMIAGARVEVSDKKREPLDFALWKAAKPGEPSWPSPWGSGRPGWHIECSAMSMSYLGHTLDIHGGGADLIFPHHENEIAQSEAATGKTFSRYWMHVGLVIFEKEKMSKSLGNVFYVRELLKKYRPEVIRIMFINSHYRKPFDFSLKNLEDSKTILEKIWSAYFDFKKGEKCDHCDICDVYEKKIISALEDDFNTREAMTHYLQFISEAREGNLGLCAAEFMEKIDYIFDILPRGVGKSMENELVDLIVEIRNKLRNERKYDLSDWIRNSLLEIGIKIEDTAQGSRWIRIR